MGKGFVGLGHFVGVFLLLNAQSFVPCGIHELGCKTVLKVLALTATCVADDPSHGEGIPFLGTDFQRDLIGGTSNPSALNLKGGPDIVHGLAENRNRILTCFLGYHFEGTVNDGFGNGPLALEHDIVDEFCYDKVAVSYVRKNFSSLWSVSSHLWYPALRFPFRSIFGTALFSTFHSTGILHTTDDVITDTGKVLHSATPYEYNGVLVEVVALSGDVRRNLETVTKPYTGNLTESRVGLFRCRSVHTGTNTLLLWAIFESRSLGLLYLLLAPFSHQLINGGQT